MLATALQWQWSERAAVYYCFINILRHVGSCSRCGRANWLNQRGAWQLVAAHCGGCHSLQLVTSNRGDRQIWLETIRWMQERQNLWQLDTQTEDQILTYLADNYPARAPRRRKPLAADLLPRN